jgi:hypothetical protein
MASMSFSSGLIPVYDLFKRLLFLGQEYRRSTTQGEFEILALWGIIPPPV